MTTYDSALLDRIGEIVEAKGAVPENLDPFAFSREMLPLLGTTDGKLREYRVYPILHFWVTRRHLADEHLRSLLETVIDEEHLFAGIGEVESDTVYLRAFSVLLLASFARAHREKAYLEPEDLDRLVATIVRYLGAERDLRGYVSAETLWAHATAHAADALGELAQCEEVGPDGLRRILDGLGRSIVIDRTVWSHEEDARAATAMIHALKRGALSEDDVSDWLSSLVPESRYEGDQPGTHRRYVNARNLLRCLIHQGEGEGLPPRVVELVRDAHAALPES